MNKQGAFVLCYDTDGVLFKYTTDENTPYQYYNPYGDMWYFDSNENEYLIDSEGNTELFYKNGDYSF